MKKNFKKLIAILMTTTLAAGMTACSSGQSGNSSNNEVNATVGENTTTASNAASVVDDPLKPEKITIMCNGTVITEANGAEAFYEQLGEAIGGVELEWIRPDHSGYADAIGVAFADMDSVADVVLLPASYYASYAQMGALWDMTDAWYASNTYNSGRLIAAAETVFNGNFVAGPDGEMRLYGFTPQRGNGCVTYVKKTWLKAAGITKLPTTFDEYIEMLRKMKKAMNAEYVVSASGLITQEAPYTNYLPEFYQDAYPEFYYNGTEWVDGFSEPAMAEALQRLRDAYQEGLIDQECITNSTSDCRNKFYDDKFGVFTYWAGTWAQTLSDKLVANDLDGDLMVMTPIAEVGYYERLTPVWAITVACDNPEGVFKYFIDTMLDGSTVQTLWQYGAEGVHWSTAEETFYVGDKEFYYAEGVFHMLPSPEDPSTLMKKNHIDPLLKLADFLWGDDPGYSEPTEAAKESFELFNNNSVAAPAIMTTDVSNDYSGTIWTYRSEVVSKVVTGEMTVEEGMAYYHENCDGMLQEIYNSFNGY